MIDPCREAFEAWRKSIPACGKTYEETWQAAWNARGEHDASSADATIIPVRYVDGGKMLGEQIVTEVPSDS